MSSLKTHNISMKRHDLLLLIFLASLKLTEDVSLSIEGPGSNQVLHTLTLQWQLLPYLCVLSAVVALRRPGLNEILSSGSFHVPN